MRIFAWPDPAADDPLLAFALARAAGRRVLLTGGDAEGAARATLALRRDGAAFTLVASPHPPPEADAALREAAARWMIDAEPLLQHEGRGHRHLPAAQGLICDLPEDWWVRAEVPSEALAHHAGRIDILLELKPLAHRPDPLARLLALAATGARALLIEGAPDAERWLAPAGLALREARLRAGRHLWSLEQITSGLPDV